MARQGWRSTLRGVATWVALCAVLACLAAAWHVPARVMARFGHAAALERESLHAEPHARPVPGSVAPAWLARLRPLSELAREGPPQLREPAGAAFTPDSSLPDRAAALAGSGRCSASLPQWLATGRGARRVCSGGAAARAPPRA